VINRMHAVFVHRNRTIQVPCLQAAVQEDTAAASAGLQPHHVCKCASSSWQLQLVICS
jgi:hypothetical protein